MSEIAALIAAYVWYGLFLCVPAAIGFFMWNDHMDDLRAKQAEKRGLYSLAQKHAYYRCVRVETLEHLNEDHGTYTLPTEEGQFLRDRLRAFLDKQLGKPVSERPGGRPVYGFVPFNVELRTR